MIYGWPPSTNPSQQQGVRVLSSLLVRPSCMATRARLGCGGGGSGPGTLRLLLRLAALWWETEASVVVVEMTAHHPSSTGNEAVEIGVDSLWAEFGALSGEVSTCHDSPPMAMCASTTISKGEDSSSWHDLGSTTMRCWNSSSISKRASATGAFRAWVDLSLDKIADFDTTTTVVLEEGVFCAEASRNAFATWTFRTVSAPEVPDDAKTANTTVTTKKYSVYGLGVFLNDVATIDMGAGTFYGDVSIYALR